MMKEAQSLKLKAESLLLDIQGLKRGRSLFSFLHSALCFKLFTFSFLLFAFCFSCSSASKEDSNADTWDVTISGKVGFPQQGQITIQEIKNELNNLTTQRIGKDELITAKNHFIGSLQAEITTPFANADKIKNIILFDLPSDYYQVLLNKIDLLDENNLIETAQQYFNPESFSVVAAG